MNIVTEAFLRGILSGFFFGIAFWTLVIERLVL